PAHPLTDTLPLHDALPISWLYPSQRLGWSMVGIEKLGSWFLLLIISYTLVSLVNPPQKWRGKNAGAGVRSRDDATVDRMSVPTLDRKSTRLNSSHVKNSYA